MSEKTLITYPQFVEMLSASVKANEFITPTTIAVSLEKAFLGNSADSAKKTELEKTGLLREAINLLAGNNVPEKYAYLVAVEVTPEFAKKLPHLCETIEGKTAVNLVNVLGIGYRLQAAKEARESVIQFLTPSVGQIEVKTGGPTVKFTVVIPQEKPEVKK